MQVVVLGTDRHLVPVGSKGMTINTVNVDFPTIDATLPDTKHNNIIIFSCTTSN